MAGERILIVDDEVHIVRLCTRTLAEEGYDVQGTTSGLEAIAWLDAQPFDLLIVDIQMPDVDGLTVLRHGRSTDPNLTSLIITGYATLDRAIEALRAGARAFLLKPFDFEELIETVGEALSQREKEQERLRLQAQQPIWEIGQTLMTGRDLDHLAQRLLEVVVRQADAERALLCLLVDEGGELRIAAAVGMAGADILGRSGPVETGPIDEALRGTEPLLFEPGGCDDLTPPWDALGEDGEAQTCVLVPLRAAERVVGLLGVSGSLASRMTGILSHNEPNLLSIMAGQIALVLENARLYATEQQRADALAQTLEQQQELERLKDEFVRNVSHELRTPLSMILGYAELLSSGEMGELTEEQEGPLHVVLDRARHLRDMVESITAILVSEGREPLRHPVSLAEIVSRSLSDFRLVAERAGVTLQGDFREDVRPVLGDAIYLRSVVDNLIGNAIKFTPPGGIVSVALRDADDKVLVEVSDTGIGIAEEHRDRIFGRFYQVDGSLRRTHGGSGLGLAVVKETVERHGGQVRVESQVDRGSIFTVELPAARGI